MPSQTVTCWKASKLRAKTATPSSANAMAGTRERMVSNGILRHRIECRREIFPHVRAGGGHDRDVAVDARKRAARADFASRLEGVADVHRLRRAPGTTAVHRRPRPRRRI